MIKIKFNQRIALKDFLKLYRQASFEQGKLNDSPKRLQSMLDHTQLMVTVWDDENLVGLARCLTDYESSCYLSELVISTNYRGRGLGKRLLMALHAYLGGRVSIVLRAAPKAVGFYQALGYQEIANLVRLYRED